MYIYLTENLLNNKKYIGMSTRSINDSKNYLGSGILLSKAIKKYGRINFSKTILEEVNSLEELSDSEIKWIKHYNAVKSNEFYNVDHGGFGGIFWDSKDELELSTIRKKISSKLKIHWSNNKDLIIERLRQYHIKAKSDRKDRFFKFFSNLYEMYGIEEVIKYKRKTYFKDWLNSNNNIQKEYSVIVSAKYSKSNTKHQLLYMFNMEGELIKSFESLPEAIKEMNINSKGTLIMALQGNRNSYAGYRWSYSEIPNDIIHKKRIYSKTGKQNNPSNHVNVVRAKILQFDKQMNMINEFNNKEEASEHTGFSAQMIARKAREESEYKGYIWKREIIKETIRK